MSLGSGFHYVSFVELLVLTGALWAFLRARTYRIFPAFGAFLLSRLIIDLALNSVLQCVRLGILEKHDAYQIYFYTYWGSYLAGAVIVFLVVQELFGRLTKLLPSSGRFFLLGFRWVTVISVLAAIMLTIRMRELNWSLVASATSNVMRCMSFLELCLLAFVIVAMQTFQLSPQSRDFGITLGLGLMAAAHLFESAFAFGHTSMATVANYSGEIASVLAAAIWAGYFLRETETAVKPLITSSSLPPVAARWNEISDALSNPRTRAASTRLFLEDVEKAVDRVLENNSGRAAR